MPSATPARKDITGFLILLAFFALAAVILTTSSKQGRQIVGFEASQDPSIDNTRASGSRGLFEWTQKLGYDATAWRRDFEALPDNASVMFCIAPDGAEGQEGAAPSDDSDDNGDEGAANDPTAAEGRAVRSWLARGHTLILFASSLPTTGGGDDGARDTFGSEIGLKVESALGATDQRREFAPMQPTAWTSGVLSIKIHPGYRLYRASDDGIPLFGDVITTPFRPRGHPHLLPATLHEQPVALVYPVGRGRVIAVADDVFGCNANLCRADNALFIYRILSQSAPAGSVVLFDEYHRGFGGGSPSLWAALGHPVQMAVIQLGLVLVIGLLVLIPRLGRPEPLQRRRERSTAEYVTSLANLYRNAGATATALETIYRQFLRELCQRFGQPTDITLSELAQIAARRGGVDGDGLRKLLAACEKALESKSNISDRDLINLVRGIEHFRKELGIG